jgi:enamine deaminase RidA (YjgF/YER057c/UK114 family)
MSTFTLQRVEPKGLAAKPGYSQVMLCKEGTVAYIAGQLPEDVHGNVVGVGDVHAQTEQVFANLALALQSIGCSFAQVAKFTLYMRDLSQISAFRVVRDRYIVPGQQPACTSIEVSRFHHDDFLIVLEAVARVPNHDSSCF